MTDLLDKVRNDTNFLQRHNIMDDSFLVVWDKTGEPKKKGYGCGDAGKFSQLPTFVPPPAYARRLSGFVETTFGANNEGIIAKRLLMKDDKCVMKLLTIPIKV
ncbi:hypothetical protein AgCh_036953 [Apium graveolens]